MKFKLFLSTLIVTATTLPAVVNAAVSPYLPLKQNSAIELEIDRLVTITGYPVLKKPYHIASLVGYLEKVKDSHPGLYNRIKRYIKRYDTTLGLTHFQSQLRVSSSNEKSLHNARGLTTKSRLDIQATGFWQPNEYLIVNAGGSYSDEEKFEGYGSFISVGGRYLQADIGYREHWLSPLQGSSQMVSTQAIPMLGITLSNVEPITDWNIMYELGFGQLETVDGIVFDGKTSEGEPGHLTMHLSAQLTDWWTVSGNRTMQFGGGDRGTVDLGEVWQAIIDPVSSDNCGGSSDLQDCNKEFGNQQASIASRMDLNWGDTPYSLIVEIAGEDTNDFKAYKLGNKAYSVGVFLPYLSPTESMNFTVQYIEDAWYSHHLYQKGLSNGGHVMGHWWGDEKRVNDVIGAKVFSVGYTKDFGYSSQLRLEYHTINNEYSETIGTHDYERGHYLKADYQWIYKGHFLGLHLYSGTDLYGKSFNSLSFSKQW